MRNTWYLFLFFLPTVLVVTGFLYRKELHHFMVEKGVLTAPAETAKQPVSPTAKAQPTTAPARQPANSKPTSPASPAKAAPAPMKFKPLEELVGNWQSIPQSAFPKTVEIRKPVAVQLVANGKVIGSSKIAEGTKMHPISAAAGVLTVATSPDEAAPRGTVSLDDTDFKAQVREYYESWKQRQTALQLKQQKEAEERGPEPAQPAAGDEPQMKAGRIPIMEASIKAGQVKEIKLEKILYWRLTGQEQIDGVTYWTGVVGYMASTVFGEIHAEGKALMREGKVVKWVYSGSEEPIH